MLTEPPMKLCHKPRIEKLLLKSFGSMISSTTLGQGGYSMPWCRYGPFEQNTTDGRSVAMNIHGYATAGDIVRVQEEMAKGVPVESYNERGQTLLMVAVDSSDATLEMVQCDMDQGA